MIVTATQLNDLLTKGNVVVIDVSTKQESFKSGREVYKNEHIPGAVFLDIKEDLTGDNEFVPQPDKLAKKLGDLGIANETNIVLYDRGTNRQVAKAFLVLTYLGHERISILQGGFQAWKEAGYDTETEIPRHEKTIYEPKPNEQIILNINDIKQRLDIDDASVLIDSRAHERYTGEKEPKYKKAGHIPGAKNYFSRDVLEGEVWKSEAELTKHFATIDKDEEVIVSCGSGNSACLNFVALKAAGYDNVKIYPGGFSEWIEDDENEVATEEE